MPQAVPRSPVRPAQFDQIVLLHPQKTGGTALFSAIERLLKPSTARWGALALDDLSARDVALIGSHNPMRDFPLDDGRNRLIVATIRDPVDRLVSLYRYWRSMTWQALSRQPSPAAIAAKEATLLEWLSDDTIAKLIEDGLVQHFCADPATDAAARLASAITHAKRVSYFFLQTELQEDASRFFSALGWPLADFPTVNVNDSNHALAPGMFEMAEPVPLDAATLHALEARTRLDREFFDALRAMRVAAQRAFATNPPISHVALNLRDISDGMTVNSRGLVVAPPVLAEGWADPDEWHVWSSAKQSSIMFRAHPGVRTCVIKIHAQTPDMRPLLWADIECCEKAIKVAFIGNGAEIPLSNVAPSAPFLAISNANPFNLHVPMPKPYGIARDVRITIKFNNIATPASLGVNEDHRLLGIALYSLTATSDPARHLDLWRSLSPPNAKCPDQAEKTASG